MSDLNKLNDGYTNKLKKGTLWNGAGKCKGYAVSNPGEAALIDRYVQQLVAGGNPAAPVLSTLTGQGIVEIIQGGYAPAAAQHTVTVVGTPQVGQTLKAVVS